MSDRRTLSLNILQTEKFIGISRFAPKSPEHAHLALLWLSADRPGRHGIVGGGDGVGALIDEVRPQQEDRCRQVPGPGGRCYWSTEQAG